MKIRIKKIILFSLIIISFELKSQPFINEILAFRKADSINMPLERQILFIGSSSFTNWKDIAKAFPNHSIINRGFGGSSLPHLILYAEDVIYKYNPKQIVIYCGENDLTGGDQITSNIITDRFIELYLLIRKKYPKINIAYISMKPSPSRIKYMSIMIDANFKIKTFIENKKRSQFINIYDSMLNEDNSIREDIFLADKLHMNKFGYDIWKKIIEPYLVK